MSEEHIQIADPGPNHCHDGLAFENHRHVHHEQEDKSVDVDEKELHHDLDEKDATVPHVPHSNASIDTE